MNNGQIEELLDTYYSHKDDSGARVFYDNAVKDIIKDISKRKCEEAPSEAYLGTKGEWVVSHKLSIQVDPNEPLRTMTICQVFGNDEESKVNAKLISDAGTTASKCGLFPSEILAQRNEMLEALMIVKQKGLTSIYTAEEKSKIMSAIKKATK
jgi:hypothetical protein